MKVFVGNLDHDLDKFKTTDSDPMLKHLNQSASSFNLVYHHIISFVELFEICCETHKMVEKWNEL